METTDYQELRITINISSEQHKALVQAMLACGFEHPNNVIDEALNNFLTDVKAASEKKVIGHLVQLEEDSDFTPVMTIGLTHAYQFGAQFFEEPEQSEKPSEKPKFSVVK